VRKRPAATRQVHVDRSLQRRHFAAKSARRRRRDDPRRQFLEIQRGRAGCRLHDRSGGKTDLRIERLDARRADAPETPLSTSAPPVSNEKRPPSIAIGSGAAGCRRVTFTFVKS
jgi:hypothetical protein